MDWNNNGIFDNFDKTMDIELYTENTPDIKGSNNKNSGSNTILLVVFVCVVILVISSIIYLIVVKTKYEYKYGFLRPSYSESEYIDSTNESQLFCGL